MPDISDEAIEFEKGIVEGIMILLHKIDESSRINIAVSIIMSSLMSVEDPIDKKNIGSTLINILLEMQGDNEDHVKH